MDKDTTQSWETTVASIVNDKQRSIDRLLSQSEILSTREETSSVVYNQTHSDSTNVIRTSKEPAGTGSEDPPPDHDTFTSVADGSTESTAQGKASYTAKATDFFSRSKDAAGLWGSWNNRTR